MADTEAASARLSAILAGDAIEDDHESGDEGNGAPTEAWANPHVEGDAEEEPGPVAAAPHAAPESHNPFHRVGAAEAKVDEAFATEVAAVFAQTGFTPVPKGVIPALKPEAFAKLDPESQHIVRTLTDRLVNAEVAVKRLKRNLARTENELALAKASSGGDLAKELESRRQALFAMSRGNASPGVLCLRSYVIMTCPAVSACLVDGDDAAVHGDIKLNDVACAGYLKKKGGKRHNWNNRWFIFDLRHRKVGYFEDQSLKKECGLFGMETVMHALKAPASGADGARGEADARKLLVVTPKRTYQLEAPTAESADLWLAVFNTIISEESKVIKDQIALAKSFAPQ